jgi:hypothetical protein
VTHDQLALLIVFSLWVYLARRSSIRERAVAAAAQPRSKTPHIPRRALPYISLYDSAKTLTVLSWARLHLQCSMVTPLSRERPANLHGSFSPRSSKGQICFSLDLLRAGGSDRLCGWEMELCQDIWVEAYRSGLNDQSAVQSDVGAVNVKSGCAINLTLIKCSGQAKTRGAI